MEGEKFFFFLFFLFLFFIFLFFFFFLFFFTSPSFLFSVWQEWNWHVPWSHSSLAKTSAVLKPSKLTTATSQATNLPLPFQPSLSTRKRKQEDHVALPTLNHWHHLPNPKKEILAFFSFIHSLSKARKNTWLPRIELLLLHDVSCQTQKGNADVIMLYFL